MSLAFIIENLKEKNIFLEKSDIKITKIVVSECACRLAKICYGMPFGIHVFCFFFLVQMRSLCIASRACCSCIANRACCSTQSLCPCCWRFQTWKLLRFLWPIFQLNQRYASSYLQGTPSCSSRNLRFTDCSRSKDTLTLARLSRGTKWTLNFCEFVFLLPSSFSAHIQTQIFPFTNY